MCHLYGIICLLFRTLLVWDECYFSSFYINGPNKSPFIRVPMQSWHRKNINRDALGPYIGPKNMDLKGGSLRTRRLEVVGTRKNGRTRRRHARGEGCQVIRLGAGNDFRRPSGQALPHPSRVSLARARSLFRPLLLKVAKRMLRIMRILNYFGISRYKLTRNWITSALTSCL